MSKKKILEAIQAESGLDPTDVAAGAQSGNFTSMSLFGRAVFTMNVESLQSNKKATLFVQEADDTSGTNEQSLKSAVFTAGSAGQLYGEIEVDDRSLSSGKKAIRPKISTDETTTKSVVGTVITLRGDASYEPADL